MVSAHNVKKGVSVWPSVLHYMNVSVELFRKNSDLNGHLNSQSSIFVCLFIFFSFLFCSFARFSFSVSSIYKHIVSIFMLGCFRSMERFEMYGINIFLYVATACIIETREFAHRNETTTTTAAIAAARRVL